MPDKDTTPTEETGTDGDTGVTVNVTTGGEDETPKTSKKTKIIIGILIIVIVVLIAIGIVLLATGNTEAGAGAGAAAAAAAAEAFRRRTASRKIVNDAKADAEATGDAIRENRENVNEDMSDARDAVGDMTDEEKVTEGNDLFGGGK